MSDLPKDSLQLSSNRLTIAHLLLWTATTAVAIGAIMPEPVEIADQESDVTAAFRARLNWYLRLATVVTGPILGAGLAALPIAVWRYWRGFSDFPSQPGHWILMIIGTLTLTHMDLRMIDHVEIQFEHGERPQWLLSIIFLVGAGMLLFTVGWLIAAYVHISEPLRWKRVFAIAGASGAFFFCGGCCLSPWPGPTTFPQLFAMALLLPTIYATPASILVASILDLRTGRPYDVFHWVGAAAVPALAVVLTGLVTVLEFARP